MKELLTDSQKDFSLWLADFASNLRVGLQIRRTYQINARCDHIHDVLALYAWKAVWPDGSHESENWETTKKSTAALRHSIVDSLSTGHNILEACKRIIHWGGGERFKGKGAERFLEDKAGLLRSYLTKTRQEMRLDEVGEPLTVELMNSMLTKIYAFMADDGLPIYDSRVAATAAMFVELYRVDRGLGWNEVPLELRFPALPPRAAKKPNARSLEALGLRSPSPGTLRYPLSHNHVLQWCLAKKHLGRVLMNTLIQNPILFASEGSTAARMHAFEASMFMLGYDLTCFSAHIRQ